MENDDCIEWVDISDLSNPFLIGNSCKEIILKEEVVISDCTTAYKSIVFNDYVIHANEAGHIVMSMAQVMGSESLNRALARHTWRRLEKRDAYILVRTGKLSEDV